MGTRMILPQDGHSPSPPLLDSVSTPRTVSHSQRKTSMVAPRVGHDYIGLSQRRKDAKRRIGELQVARVPRSGTPLLAVAHPIYASGELRLSAQQHGAGCFSVAPPRLTLFARAPLES